MQKCVKVTITGVDIEQITDLYKLIKKKAILNEIEGVAYPHKKMLEIIIRGPKEHVDRFIGVIDEAVITYSMKNQTQIDFFMEPILDKEDYRGVFRFLLTLPNK